MATDTLTLPDVTDQVNTQWTRLSILLEINGLALDAIPNDTDSDCAIALLTGMKEIIRADMVKMQNLFEALTAMVGKNCEVAHV